MGSRSRGIAATKRLSGRSPSQRGGSVRQSLLFDRSDPQNMADYADSYLDWLEVRNYTHDTLRSRRHCLDLFLQWCQDRDLARAPDISKPILESYQRHLHRYRKTNGKPLGHSTQCQRLLAVKDFFRWLCRSNFILFNPASELELPRKEKRLPEEPLSIAEVETVLSQPDLSDPLGVRDRALLEVLYSCGLRRKELTQLELTDLHLERRTLRIRQGKGHKDRVVPVGKRALAWLEKYLDTVRPQLDIHTAEHALFLSSYGEPFNPDVLSRMATKYIKAAELGRGGSCHLFRHTCATHMLEGGADIRFIQQLLGHAKLETTQIYTEVSIKQLQEVHERTHPAKLGKKSEA